MCRSVTRETRRFLLFLISTLLFCLGKHVGQRQHVQDFSLETVCFYAFIYLFWACVSKFCTDTRIHTLRQPVKESVCICAQYSDLQTFMLSHWQLWVIAPCSGPYPWTTFNYVTKLTCSPALMSPPESQTITFTRRTSLPKSQKKKVCLLTVGDKLTPWYFVDVSQGLSFVLRMIRNLKIMCSKSVECLEKLKGSRGAEAFFSCLFEDRAEQRQSTDNTNERPHCNIFLGHHGSFMSCMAYAWNISPTGDGCACVCVLSIIVGADECEVKHTYQPAACHSQFHVGQVPLVTLQSRNRLKHDCLTTKTCKVRKCQIFFLTLHINKHKTTSSCLHLSFILLCNCHHKTCRQSVFN